MLNLYAFTKAEQPSNLPNLRRLFVEARTEAEESAYSRNAVSRNIHLDHHLLLFQDTTYWFHGHKTRHRNSVMVEVFTTREDGFFTMVVSFQRL